MSFENTRSITFLPTPTEAVGQYRFVQLIASTGTVQQVSAAGGIAQPVMGVSLESSLDSDDTGVSFEQASSAIPITLLDGARQEVEAGATITVGEAISSDTVGRATPAISTYKILGYAESAASVGEAVTFIGLRDGIVA